MNKKPVYYFVGMIILFLAVNVFGYSYVDLYYFDILVGFAVSLIFTIGGLFFTIKMIFKEPGKWYHMVLAIIISLLGIACNIYVILLFFK